MTGGIVFDLDGTLVDSAPDLQEAVNRTLADAGRPPLDLETIKSFVGNGLAKTVERSMVRSGMDLDQHATCLDATYAHYDAVSGMHSELYPHVAETLEALSAAGHPLGICTNKTEGAARHVLAHLGLSHLFGALVGADTLPVMKPDPAPLIACYQQLGSMPILYVGDSETDAATAQAVGIPFALYSGGYRKTPVTEIPNWRVFDGFEELPSLVAERKRETLDAFTST